jgi:hypothetical protein
MHLFGMREPINAWSHGAATLLVLPVSSALEERSRELGACGPKASWESASITEFR